MSAVSQDPSHTFVLGVGVLGLVLFTTADNDNSSMTRTGRSALLEREAQKGGKHVQEAEVC